MTRLQAAMKDISARKWKEQKLMKQVGCPLLKWAHCRNCGSYQVFKYYEPIAAGRTFWCWDCGAIDEQAWGKNWKTSRQKKPQSIKQTIGRKRQSRMNITAFKLIERF